MPWQMAPPLIIICGAFTATSVLLWGVDQIFLGRNKRILIRDYEFKMDKREERIQQAKWDAATPEERKSMPSITRFYRF